MVSRVFFRPAWRLPTRRHLTTLGIRREDPKRIWERRVPLTPEAIRSLVTPGQIDVEVESCERRCFPNVAFQEVCSLSTRTCIADAQAGAKIVPRLTKAVDVALGIKEPPVEEVEALKRDAPGKDRKWMVFSHTHKGQVSRTLLEYDPHLGLDVQHRPSILLHGSRPDTDRPRTPDCAYRERGSETSSSVRMVCRRSGSWRRVVDDWTGVVETRDSNPSTRKTWKEI